MWTYTFIGTVTGRHEVLVCPGSLTITPQAGGTFTGSFIFQPTTECEATSGNVTRGAYGPDGSIGFELEFPPSSDPIVVQAVSACSQISGSERLLGSIAGNRIRASARVVIDCGSPDTHGSVTLAVAGSR